MFFKSLDLTTALRPLLLPDETLLFAQDAVGLYEGYVNHSVATPLMKGGRKYKIPEYQNGHAYLTSHRICYIAVDAPRKCSVGIELKEIDRVEYQVRAEPPSPAAAQHELMNRQAGFLKSSPKVTLYPKPQKNNPTKSTSAGASPSIPQPANLMDVKSASPLPPPSQPAPTPKAANATWICPICSFSNPVPPAFDPVTATPSTLLPACLACGIKPPFTTVLKAAITAAAGRDATSAASTVSQGDSTDLSPGTGATISCPRCTFVNHPYLNECEMCGGPLSSGSRDRNGTESPAPFFDQSSIRNTEIVENIKLSFRAGGEKIFHERLKNALVQRKWLLYNAPPVPRQSQSMPSPSMAAPVEPVQRSAGIAGLERRGLEARKNNEVVIGNAFEDLEALMASAKQIVGLAETLARESGMTSDEGSAEANTVLSESAAALGMITTKDMLGSGAENLYLSELARDLAEYLTDDRRGILHKEGGIMSLIDLWAVFNRSRNGVELVSPSDFQRAAELWEKLRLPVRLRRFKSGLLVVQRYDWSDETTIRQLQEWMEELRQVPPSEPVLWDWRAFGRAVTAQEAAQRFKWSVGVAAEELEMAEDRGVLCREEGIEGLRFWGNHIQPGLDEISLSGLDL